jgi:hypothetical protein
MHNISAALTEYFRCPDKFATFIVPRVLSHDSGYFRFASDVICYGRTEGGFRCAGAGEALSSINANCSGGDISLPFVPNELVDNLRREHYAATCRPSVSRKGINRLVSDVYYALRPWMPVRLRKHLQRIRQNGWRQISFPAWPNDTSVDDLLGSLLALSIVNAGERVPFIWFWPEGATACLTLTHDVESQVGYDFSPTLMDIDARFGFRSSFQIVPEERYEPTLTFVNEIKRRGFEVNIHDLNHDGHLFRDWVTFSTRAAKIRDYAAKFGANGFRSAIMYRNPDWLSLLDFQYDMSIPNAGHLDPQHGGCCTIMPFAIGNMIELPLTTVQDYGLFHMLNSHSLQLWQQQTELIVRRHGFASFLVHPDYIVRGRDRDTYIRLLDYLAEVRSSLGLWAALPQEVNDWWRARANMRVVQRESSWTIEGPQSHRARLAFAELHNGRLTFELAHENAAPPSQSVENGSPGVTLTN